MLLSRELLKSARRPYGGGGRGRQVRRAVSITYGRHCLRVRRKDKKKTKWFVHKKNKIKKHIYACYYYYTTAIRWCALENFVSQTRSLGAGEVGNRGSHYVRGARDIRCSLPFARARTSARPPEIRNRRAPPKDDAVRT